MTPVHMIHALIGEQGKGGVSLAIPVYKLLFANHKDGEATSDYERGGLFRTEDGSFAIVVDARLGPEEASAQAQSELRRHWAELQEAGLLSPPQRLSPLDQAS